MGVDATLPPSSERTESGSFNIPVGSYPASSTNSTVDAEKVASALLAQFNNALSANDTTALTNLFLEDNSYWRDHLALTWDMRTLQGRDTIKTYLDACNAPLTRIAVAGGSAFRGPKFGAIDAWGDVKGISFFITFETDIGRGEGVANLAERNGEWNIFTLYTVMTELKGFEEPTRHRRVQGVAHGGDPARKNWQERRDQEIQEVEPTVLIIGAGQSGLMVAARLKMLGVPALIVERNERIGDNWRKRYKQLVLHDPVWYDHMPYLPFPPHWPVFTPKDKLAEWFTAYAAILELNVWTGATLDTPKWDEKEQRWTVTVTRKTAVGSSNSSSSGGDNASETRTLHPRHIIQATGHSGKKNMPSIPGMSDFRGGRLCHSSEHPGADPASKGKRAVVVGCCNSGHDIAQDFYEKGYDTTLVQRSTTCVISSRAILEIGLKGLYDEGSDEANEGGDAAGATPPVEDADLFLHSMPSALFKAQQIKITAAQAAFDASTLAGLEKAGFALDRGPMNAGLFIKYFQRGGGYYIDVGASSLIASGAIRVKQGQEIARVLPHGVAFADGSEIAADELVFATGYLNMRTQTAEIFGAEVADKVSDVWGFNEEGELRTMWRGSGHPGLWFMGGNLALARFFSRVLALRIKGVEEGVRGARE